MNEEQLQEFRQYLLNKIKYWDDYLDRAGPEGDVASGAADAYAQVWYYLFEDDPIYGSDN